MSSGLLWGIAGYGDIVRRRIGPALANQDFKLWGRRPERAEHVASEFGGRVSPSFEEMCKSCDAIYIAMPVAAHLPLIRIARAFGRPILCEKPFNLGLHALSAGELSDLSRGPQLGVAYYRRLALALLRLRQRIADGHLGTVRRVEIDFAFPFRPSSNDPMAWRLLPALSGGGVIADAGCHRLDIITWLFGPPAGIAAQLHSLTAEGAEREAQLTLDWEGGLVAEAHFSWNGEKRDRLVIFGTLGTVVLNLLDGGELCWKMASVTEVETFPVHANPHAVLLKDFETAITDGQAPCCPAADAMLVDNMIATAYQSGGRRTRFVTV